MDHFRIPPVLLGDRIRPYDDPGGLPVQLELLEGDHQLAAVDVRYRHRLTPEREA